MSRKTALFFVSGIILLFLLSSCSLFGGEKQPQQVAVTEEGLRTGTDSLIMSFLPNNPPNETYEGLSFDVALKVENKGASDISNGKLVLSYDRAFLKNLDTPWALFNTPTPSLGKGDSFALNIKGKTLQTPEGESNVYSKTFRANMLGNERQSADTSFTAIACYDYETRKSVPICLDSGPFKQTEKACRMAPITLQSQGGPLVITRVEPKLLSTPQGTGYELEVILYLENRGKGFIYKSGSSGIACGNQQLPENFLNVLEDGDVNLRLGTDERPDQFECGPFPAKISGKESFIRCIYNTRINEAPAYTTTLFADIKYGYTVSTLAKTTISKRLVS